ncbi:unnamed protein product, partial [Ectocarpus sp. 8 AP-2014]
AIQALPGLRGVVEGHVACDNVVVSGQSEDLSAPTTCGATVAGSVLSVHRRRRVDNNRLDIHLVWWFVVLLVKIVHQAWQRWDPPSLQQIMRSVWGNGHRGTKTVTATGGFRPGFRFGVALFLLSCP